MQTYENAATATEGQQFMNLEKKYESFYYGRYAEYAKGTSGKLQGKMVRPLPRKSPPANAMALRGTGGSMRCH